MAGGMRDYRVSYPVVFCASRVLRDWTITQNITAVPTSD